MSIIHVGQIEAKLKSMFSNLIDVSEYNKCTEAEQNSAFLTRALAAYSILVTADISREEAAGSVVDGFQDGGIDAIYFDSREKILFFVQTKWSHKGEGSIEQGDALKFINGTKSLINTDFSHFNNKIKSRSSEITNALYDANTKIVLLLAYTGKQQISTEVQHDFNGLLQEMNDPSEVMELKVLSQEKLHKSVASGSLGAPINFDVVLKDWGQVREPYSAYYGIVSATEVADWWNKHYPKIFMPNIRSFLGETEINQNIVETLLSEPEKFWYFNNGITALCSQIRKKPLGGNGHDTGIFECFDVSIVNGAQTVGAIATANKKSPEQVEKAGVSIRFISLIDCPEDFTTCVTRATNTQNRIDSRDFVSLDGENQERIRIELQLEEIEYTYKAGYTIRDIKTGFDFSEAIVAVACAHKDLNYAVQAKDKISLLYEDVSKAPYKALFNPSLSSIRLWKIVQIHRAIEEELKGEKRKRQGRESMLCVHGNRFLARQVFREIREIPTFNLDDPKQGIDDILNLIPKYTIGKINLTADAILTKYPDSYLANLFRNKTKCHDIENFLNASL
jgi:AIPR protein